MVMIPPHNGILHRLRDTSRPVSQIIVATHSLRGKQRISISCDKSHEMDVISRVLSAATEGPPHLHWRIRRSAAQTYLPTV